MKHIPTFNLSDYNIRNPKKVGRPPYIIEFDVRKELEEMRSFFYKTQMTDEDWRTKRALIIQDFAKQYKQTNSEIDPNAANFNQKMRTLLIKQLLRKHVSNSRKKLNEFPNNIQQKIKTLIT